MLQSRIGVIYIYFFNFTFFNLDFSIKNIYMVLRLMKIILLKREREGVFHTSVSWLYGAEATVVITLNHRLHSSFGFLVFILIRTPESRNERKKEVRFFRQWNYRCPQLTIVWPNNFSTSQWCESSFSRNRTLNLDLLG